MSDGCFGALQALLQDYPLVCSSSCPSTVVKIDTLLVTSTKLANKMHVSYVFMCLLFLLFISIPQENDLNDLLNSLYDLPVPKPFTPVNLSVVGIDPRYPLIRGKTAESRGKYCRSALYGKGERQRRQ